MQPPDARARSRRGAPPSFEDSCSFLGEVLSGPARREVLTTLAGPGDFGRWLLRLRRQMRAHRFRMRRGDLDLSKLVGTLDERTRLDGLCILYDWDGVSETFNPDILAVDILHYLMRKRGDGEPDPVAVAVLLDYYFLYLVTLAATRVWDEGDPAENLDTVRRLLEDLQGPEGSGHAFVADAETLLLIALSSYQPEEWAYDRMLERARSLPRPNRVRLAHAAAVVLGCHLRFGFEATYGEDMAAMRADNSVDYLWLCFALATLAGEYARLVEEGEEGEAAAGLIAEGILNGLCSDPEAFFGGTVPEVVKPFDADRSEFLSSFAEHRPRLLESWRRHRPTEDAYSPLSFRFNFPHNVLKGAVVDALLWGEPWKLHLNALLTDRADSEPADRSREALARTLTRHARSAPNRIRGRLMPVIVYDPRAGAQAYAELLGWFGS